MKLAADIIVYFLAAFGALCIAIILLAGWASKED